MIIYTNAGMLHGNTQAELIKPITIGFTDQLHGWWEYYLTLIQKTSILTSVKLNEEGKPLLNAYGQTISNVVETLVHNILINFSGNVSDQNEKYREQLINLRCRTLSDFRWYKDVFLSLFFQLFNSNEEFWKEKFISGLPTHFAEKIKNVLREQNNGRLNYANYTYGD